MPAEQRLSDGEPLPHTPNRFFDLSLDLMCMVGFDGYLKQVNPMWTHLLGWSEQELLSQPVANIIHPEDHSVLQQARTVVRDGGEAGRIEIRYRHRDNSYRWIWWNVFPQPNEQVIYAIGRDITEQKAYEALNNGQKQLLEMIATGQPLHATLDALVRLLEQQFTAMKCSVLLMDADGLHLRHIIAPSLPQAYCRAIDGAAIGPTAGSCGTASFRRELVIAEDIALDPLWADYRALALPHGIRACWSTPIFDAARTVLGTFAIYYNQPSRPSAKHMHLIEMATHVAAIAISKQRDEIALLRSQSRHQRFIESGIMGVMVADMDGVISEANDTFLNMIGYTRAELEAGMLRWDTLTPPQWRAVDERIIAELKKSGSCTPVEKEYIRKDGSRLPILAAITLFDEASTNGLCLIQDLTERKRIERELRRSEEKFTTVFRDAPVWMAITDMANGRYLDVNEHALRVAGFAREEIIGRTAAEVGWLKPNERQVLIDEIARHGKINGMEIAFRNRTGETLYGWVTGKQVFIDERPYLLTVSTDITERRESEIRLRESEQRFLELTENIGEVFWITDATRHHVIYVSTAYEKIWGRSCQSLYDSPISWLEAICSEDRERIKQASAKMLTGTYDEQYRVNRPDGSQRWIQDKAFIIKDESGTIMRIVGIAKDITEQRQLEAQLRQAQKMEAIGTLAGGIAHDFNNILAAVSGYAQLAKADSQDRPDLQEYLDAVLKGSRRAAELVKQIITFSRQQLTQRSPVQLQKIVTEVLVLLRATIPTTIEIKTIVESKAPAVLADATQIHQILMNLCTNAWHAMKDQPGRLEISVEQVDVDDALVKQQSDLKPGTYVRLTVIDTGCGMDTATLARIFEPFFTTKAPGYGSGLGLAVVHGIMRNHQGAITVHSTVAGGATFRLYFPAHISNDIPSVETFDAGIPPGHGERILIVDDEVPIVQLGTALLRKLDYVVQPHSNSTEALTTLLTSRDEYDLVISDLAMPGMSGIELVEQLRKHHPALPIIVISGYVDAATEERITRLGVQQVLLKPFTLESLGIAVHRVLLTRKVR